MQIKLELLEQNLQAKILPVYLICGDEPFLIQEGYLKRTSRGRMATTRAYHHFQRTYRGQQTLL